MILVLCIFPYHDGRLLDDERLRHYDFWLNDFCLFVTISRCLKLLVRSLFFLSDYTPSCILEFSVWFLCMFSLVFMVLLSRRLALSLQLSFF